MKITFLGVGCAFCNDLFQTNVLIDFDETNLLIDCGSTASRSMNQLGISGKEIRNIFITHSHADHIGGLEQFALSAKYFWKTKPNLYIYNELADRLWERSLRGGLEFTDTETVDLDYYFNVHRLKDSFDLGNCHFELIPTEHVRGMLNFGLFFDGIYLSGDAKFSRERIIEQAAQANLIIHDCDYVPNPVHTYIEDMKTLPLEIREKTFLVHYSNDYKRLEKKAFPLGLRMIRQHVPYEIDQGIILNPDVIW